MKRTVQHGTIHPTANQAVVRVQEKLDHVEDLLTSGMRIEQARAQMRAEGVSPRQARRLTALVYARWAREGRILDRDAKRDHIRAALWEVYRRAMARQGAAVVPGGKGVPSRVEYYDDPDLRSANSALETLGRLEAVMEAPAVPVALVPSGIILAIQKAYGLAPDDAIDATPKPLALPGEGR